MNEDFISELAETLNEVFQMLCEKNAAYGNSALEPVRVFSRAMPMEQLRVRMDDKLSRLANRAPLTEAERAGFFAAFVRVFNPSEAAGEDAQLDLIGYLILLRMAGRAK
jgi:hypothetical protein